MYTHIHTHVQRYTHAQPNTHTTHAHHTHHTQSTHHNNNNLLASLKPVIFEKQSIFLFSLNGTVGQFSLYLNKI